MPPDLDQVDIFVADRPDAGIGYEVRISAVCEMRRTDLIDRGFYKRRPEGNARTSMAADIRPGHETGVSALAENCLRKMIQSKKTMAKRTVATLRPAGVAVSAAEQRHHQDSQLRLCSQWRTSRVHHQTPYLKVSHLEVSCLEAPYLEAPHLNLKAPHLEVACLMAPYLEAP